MYLLLGIIIGLLNAVLILILYSRRETILTRYIDKTLQNKEKAQFLEPISPEEKINEIFNE